MIGHLLTWSPRDADDQARYAGLLRAVQRRRVAYVPWTTGGHRNNYVHGDDVYLLRQSGYPRQPHLRGLIAHGRLLSDGVHEEPHWREAGQMVRWALTGWDEAVEPERGLPLAVLQERLPSINWLPQRSGTALPADTLSVLRNLWLDHIARKQASGKEIAAEASPATKELDRLVPQDVLPQLHDVLGFGVTWDYKTLGTDDPVVVRVKFPSPSDPKQNKEKLARLRSQLLKAQLPRRVAIVEARAEGGQ